MTQLFGSANGMAKLKECEVLEIYEMAWSGQYTQAEIAEMFGVGRECVSYIKLAKNWKWLTQNQEEKTNMTVETKYDKSHHSGGTPEARIANRLRNSGGNDADHIAKHGDGPTRAITNIHHAGHYVQPGTAAREGDPQEQRHHDSATAQGATSHFTGYKGSE